MDKDAGRTGHPSSATGSPAVDVDPAEFAEYLRAERERRRLTIDQIADETKIASRHLAALERGDVRNWPGGMYRRAMMRAYAESIGVDREYALQQFERAFEPKAESAPPAEEPVTILPPVIAAWRPARAAALVAVGVAAAVIVTASWRWATSPSVSESEPQTVARPIADSPVHARNADSQVQLRQATAPMPEAPVLRATSDGSTATSGTQQAQPVPAPVPAPVVPASEGNILVSSSPAGARVTVNGIGWGETPLTIRHLPLGTKRVRLTMPGYISAERVVTLGPEHPSARVTLSLRARD